MLGLQWYLALSGGIFLVFALWWGNKSLNDCLFKAFLFCLSIWGIASALMAFGVIKT
jgi:hypothetical protein